MLNISSWIRTMFVVCAGTCCFHMSANVAAQESLPSEQLLPANTKAWISIPDSEALKAALEKTQFGQMMNDENVKPFVDDLTEQFRNWLNRKNIRFGMKVADIECVKSGEIAVAGVLPRAAVGVDTPPQHAIVLLVDVAETKPQAEELLKKVAKELKSREATEESIKVGDITATKWSFKKPRGLREKQYAYHAIAGNWLLACDNEPVFRQMINRVTSTEARTAVLATSPAFIKINEKCQFADKKFDTHIRWFVEPFGYVQLAQAIADSKNGRAELRNDNARIFHEEGFSAIQGVGGTVAIATDEHELVHRSFVFAPAQIEGPERFKRAAAMLDFKNPDKSDLSPPHWIPQDSASYLSFTWDLRKALDKVGYVVEATSGTEGSWERTLNSLRTDPSGPRVDVRELVSNLNNRVTVCTVTELPINESSERILIGIKIRHNEAMVADSVKRMVQPRKGAEMSVYNGREIMLVDTTKADEDLLDDLEGLGELDDFGADPLSENGDVAHEDEDLVEPKLYSRSACSWFRTVI